MEIIALSGLTKAEKDNSERALKSKGYVETITSSLSVGQYKTTSFSGNAEAFGNVTKFNIEWC